MSLARRSGIAALVLFFTAALAQTTQPATTTSTAVPRLVRLNSSFHPANGAAPAPVESAILAIYSDEKGGSPLWQETQSVSIVVVGGIHTRIKINRLSGSGAPEQETT